MRLENKDFGKLMKQISNSKTFIPLDIKQVKNIFRDSFNHKECVYVLDFSKNEITHQNGFQNLLGYKKNQISMDFLLNKIHHDDSELVNRIKIATIVFCLKNPVKNRTSQSPTSPDRWKPGPQSYRYYIYPGTAALRVRFFLLR